MVQDHCGVALLSDLILGLFLLDVSIVGDLFCKYHICYGELMFVLYW